MEAKTRRAAVSDALQGAIFSALVTASRAGVDSEKAQAAVRRAFTQDPLDRSLRLFGALLMVLSTILMDPTVQSELIKLIGLSVPPQYVPMATAIAGAALAILSKARDQRPVRESGPKGPTA